MYSDIIFVFSDKNMKKETNGGVQEEKRRVYGGKGEVGR